MSGGNSHWRHTQHKPEMNDNTHQIGSPCVHEFACAVRVTHFISNTSNSFVPLLASQCRTTQVHRNKLFRLSNIWRCQLGRMKEWNRILRSGGRQRSVCIRSAKYYAQKQIEYRQRQCYLFLIFLSARNSLSRNVQHTHTDNSPFFDSKEDRADVNVTCWNICRWLYGSGS